MRILLWLIMLCVAPLAWGQVGIVSVVDENKHATEEDFYHTFEYHIQPRGKNTAWKKCQATRIGKRWFATAAHCLMDCAKNGCTLYMDLLDEDYSALAIVQSTPKKPAVFIHPDYDVNIPALDDFALIRLDLHRASYSYFRRVSNIKPGLAVSKQRFNQFLDQNRRAASKLRRVLSGDLPPILSFDNDTYLLDRKLSVISIFDGVRAIKPNPYKAYYVNDLGFGYTQNFGVRSGMSGSGVMTNTGELAGIVSANLTVQTAPANAKASKSKKQTHDFFLFSAFNQPMRTFMEKTMGSDYYQLEFKDAYPHYIRRGAKADHSLIRSIVKQIRQEAAAKAKKTS